MRAALRLGGLALPLLAASAAHGQASDDAAAIELFRQGRAALEVQDYAAACPKLEESLRMSPHVGTAISLATCEEAIHRIAAARAHWMQAADLARGLADPRAAFAQSRVDAIDAHVPRLTVRLPPGASDIAVLRDGVELGPASLGVALPVEVGTHTIVVSGPKNAAVTLTVDLAEDERKDVLLTLGAVRELPPAPAAAPLPVPAEAPAEPLPPPRRPHMVLEASVELAVLRLTGGAVGQSCTSPCSSGLPFYAVPGALALVGGTYELASGFGVGVRTGFLGLTASYDNRTAQITTPGGVDSGTVRDDVTVVGVLAGVAGSYHRGDTWPLTARLGLGTYVSSTTDVRSGNFGTFGVNESESHGATYFYLAPEIRVGRRVGDHVEISAGLEAMWLASPSAPSWKDETPVSTPGGAGTFGRQTLTGTNMFVVAPGAAARYDF